MLGSTQQVARILFEKLGLTPGRKGKTGYSTDTRVLRRSAASTRSSA
jgi:DNA polymerase I-like protein with 3'-5' exonuclease and polymerase domains